MQKLELRKDETCLKVTNLEFECKSLPKTTFPTVLVPASKVLKNDLFLPAKTLWDFLHQKETALLLPSEKVLGAAVTLGLREAEHKS